MSQAGYSQASSRAMMICRSYFTQRSNPLASPCKSRNQFRLFFAKNTPHTTAHFQENCLALSIIYARSENHCIGHQGRLPWNLPDEFASFNNITDGKAVIMGRRSYEDHHSVLPNRLNIVVSRQVDYVLPAPIIF